jgi:septum formation protein
MQDLPLYLASSSPRRRQLLARAGIRFELCTVQLDEDALTAAYPGPLDRLGEYLACAKALAAYEALAREGKRGVVLAADTTVLLDGQSLAKPSDADDAARMLKLLRGREHIVATGVALARPPAAGEVLDDSGPRVAGDKAPTSQPPSLVSATAATRVLMRAYSDAEIAAYVASGDPLDKAGAYSIQHPNFSPVAEIAGCHLGVIGLPVCIVARLLGRGTLPPFAPLLTPGGALCAWSPACTPPLPTEAAITEGSACEAR